MGTIDLPPGGVELDQEVLVVCEFLVEVGFVEHEDSLVHLDGVYEQG